ncbi:unnamed protein product [Boreogadus saida]
MSRRPRPYLLQGVLPESLINFINVRVIVALQRQQVCVLQLLYSRHYCTQLASIQNMQVMSLISPAVMYLMLQRIVAVGEHEASPRNNAVCSLARISRSPSAIICPPLKPSPPSQPETRMPMMKMKNPQPASFFIMIIVQRSFSGLLCASCPASLAPGDGHLACSVCLGTDHAEAAMAAPVSCVACRELPEEGILSRHLFFSPAVDLTRWHHRRRRRRLLLRRLGIRFFPLSGYNRHRRGEIMGEAVAIKGFPMPAPPLAPVSDDMQGECFRTPSASRRVTQCPLFPPVQHLFTAAGGDPSTLKAPVSEGDPSPGASTGSASLSGRRMAP